MHHTVKNMAQLYRIPQSKLIAASANNEMMCIKLLLNLIAQENILATISVKMLSED